jgi:hypothetical protein
LHDPERRYGVPGVLEPAQDTQQVLNVGDFQELQTAVFDERDAPAGEFDLKLIAVVAGTEQRRLPLQVDARLAMLQDTLDDIVDLSRLIRGDDELRSFTRRFV